MTKSNRVSIIDILKGIMIILVIFTHFSWSNSDRTKLFFPYWVDQAVPIFMIISGYVNSYSFKRNNIKSINDTYCIKSLLPKMIRYTIPFIITYLVEIITLAFYGELTPSLCVKGFFIGGFGPGSYYYPMMIQFVFIFPFIYFIVRKYDFLGLLISGGVNIFYELIKRMYEMPTYEYRMLIFRHIFVIAFGCFIAIGKKRPNRVIGLISMTIGAFWLWLVRYNNYIPKIINKDWPTTCIFSSMWIAPIVWILLKNERIKNIKCVPLEMIGKASYNIFFTQMVYYYFGFSYIADNINSRALQIALNIIICVGVGFVFYCIENKITSKVINELKAKNFYQKELHAGTNAINNWLTK